MTAPGRRDMPAECHSLDDAAEALQQPAGVLIPLELCNQLAHLMSFGFHDLERRTGVTRRPQPLLVLLTALKIGSRRARSVSASGQVFDLEDGGASTCWLSTSEAAALIGRGERTVRRLAPQMGGRKAGRDWLIDPQQLETYRRRKELRQ